MVPGIGEATADSLARGQSLFQRSGCQQCHGTDGTGAQAPTMFDDAGRPTVPRDLVHEPLKGGP